MQCEATLVIIPCFIPVINPLSHYKNRSFWIISPSLVLGLGFRCSMLHPSCHLDNSGNQLLIIFHALFRCLILFSLVKILPFVQSPSIPPLFFASARLEVPLLGFSSLPSSVYSLLVSLPVALSCLPSLSVNWLVASFLRCYPFLSASLLAISSSIVLLTPALFVG